MTEDQERPEQPTDEDPEPSRERVEEGEETLRHRVEESLERIVPEVVKRTLEAGIGTLSRPEKGRIRGLVNALKLPKDVARYFLAQVDDTKNALLRVFAREVREFLEHTDLAEDMRKVLTSISLEISTRVSFVPNESAPGIKPDVTATVKASDRMTKRWRKQDGDDDS